MARFVVLVSCALFLPTVAKYPADKINFVGRWYADSGQSPMLSKGIRQTTFGNRFEVRFSGTTSVEVEMSTELSHEQKKPYPIYFKAETQDGQVADRLEFAGNGTKKKLKIPLHFKESKEYVLQIKRSSEAYYGETTLHDVILDHDATPLNPPALTGLRMEVVGDSITAGWDAMLPAGAPEKDENETNTEDVFRSYEDWLAAFWDISDWRVVSRAGMGVTERGGQLEMIEEYLCATFHRNGPCSQDWDFSSWQPDIVLVNLGTNDFMIGFEPSEEKFEKAYRNLLKAIRKNNPSAKVFAIRPLQYSCPSDACPACPNSDKEKWNRMSKYMKHVIDKLDDSDLHFIETGDPEDPWLDCDDDYVDGTHPTADGHHKFAKHLKRVISPHLFTNSILV